MTDSLMPTPGTPQRFAPERTHIFAIALMGLVCIIMAGWAPLYLGWTVLIPAVWIYWVLRARTVVDESGIHIRYAFRSGKDISWENFHGIAFKGARALAETNAGQQHMLPGVTFNSLPRLAAASNGRIPDALTAGRAAADEKVVIVHRDGQQILMSKEEFAAYEERSTK